MAERSCPTMIATCGRKGRGRGKGRRGIDAGEFPVAVGIGRCARAEAKASDAGESYPGGGEQQCDLGHGESRACSVVCKERVF
mmetsp:Transcript_53568/g.160313  ORF Transcript_53568/g.160313 Transcript_53568/m.160313 type:complete len:83 (-) Transcript_53568:408-656(-)